MYERSSQQIPKGWIETTLNEIALWGSGGTPSRKNNKFYRGSIPWVKTGELGPKYIRSAQEYITQEGIQRSSAKVFPKGSVGIAMYGATIGKLSIWGADLSTNQACAVAQPCLEILSSEFLYYFLLSQRYALIEAGKGGAQPNISQGLLKDWPICLPPIDEQCRIVDKIEELFSELDKGIESLKTAREQLKVYRQAVLKHAFEGKLTEQWREENKNKLETPERLRTRIKKEREKRYQQQLDQWKTAVKTWEVEGKKGRKPRKPGLLEQPEVITSNETKSLPKIPSAWCFVRLCEITDIGSGMSVNNSRKIDNPIKVPYLRVANVQRGFLDLSEVKHMTIEMSQLDSMALKQWDILFNEGGDRDKLGRGWIWQSKIMPCITQNHVFRASPYFPSKEHSTLISHWGNTFGQRYFEEMGKQTTNLASINKTVLSEFPVPLMSIDEQEEICKQIDSMMTLINAQLDEISAVLEKSTTLRQAILRSAFSGKLIPQDPNDEPASILLERIRAEKTEQEKTHGKSSRRKTGEVIV
ncbi:MAG: restriction endonuclease subunit S [Gammaproteobacteria bacterium]|nr:restriction endonuclease subunit S [Gammaproteobacteria bacterium]